MFDDKETQVILKLIKETSNEELKWKKSHLKGNESTKIGNAYETKINNNVFLIYKFKIDEYIPEFDRFESSQYVKLEIYNFVDNSLKFEFPLINSLGDLFRIVNKKAEKIDDLFDEIIGEDKNISGDDLL